MDATVAREELILQLRQVCDLERSMARIVTGNCNCRDFRQLAAGAEPLPRIRAALGQFQSSMLRILFAISLVETPAMQLPPPLISQL